VLQGTALCNNCLYFRVALQKSTTQRTIPKPVSLLISSPLAQGSPSAVPYLCENGVLGGATRPETQISHGCVLIKWMAVSRVIPVKTARIALTRLLARIYASLFQPFDSTTHHLPTRTREAVHRHELPCQLACHHQSNKTPS